MQPGNLREALSAVDQKISQLATREGVVDRAEATALSVAWTELVRVLALPDEPRVRTCPGCHKVVMRNATLCGFCWIKLTPPHAGEP